MGVGLVIFLSLMGAYLQGSKMKTSSLEGDGFDQVIAMTDILPRIIGEGKSAQSAKADIPMAFLLD